MGITVRDIDLNQDRDEVIQFLRQNLNDNSDEARFDWLYLSNPCGRARGWLASDSSGRTIGTAAAFPRHFSVGEQIRQAWVLGDFCIDRQYRTLGPALQLQRAALQSLTADQNSICYDFPSLAMMSVYGRLGMQPLGSHVRYVKLLRLDHKLEKYRDQKLLHVALSRIANLALTFSQKRQPLSEGVEFLTQESEFGAEFSSIQSMSASQAPIRMSRSAEYLNWRYIGHPLKEYCGVTARRQSELVGYAIAEIDGDHSRLADLNTIDNDEYLPGMLASLEARLRDLNVCSISASVLQTCHLTGHLRRAGFRPREGAPVMAYANSNTDWGIDVCDVRNWMLLYGDRDS